jgi:hypothetical protein
MKSSQAQVMLFRHQDARWVQLEFSLRRVDRIEGKRGQGLSHVYTIYKTPAALANARSQLRSDICSAGYRIVSKLGRYQPVPFEEWRDTALLVKRRKSVLRGPAKSALEKRVVELEAVPGIALQLKRGKPASAKALAAAEKKLGVPLPRSLQRFLAEQDGLLVEWRLDDEGWGTAFEIFSLSEMLKEWKFRGAQLKTKRGSLLPIGPTFDRPVLGALLGKKGEAKIVEVMDPPDGKTFTLAADFASFVEKAVKNYFVITGRHDVAERALPAMRKRFRA